MNMPRLLPWVRRGLAGGAPDPLSGPLPATARLRAELELRDDRGVAVATSHDVALAGPADAVGIDGAQIIRYEPPDATADFEPNYFPFVELLAPDLPWLLTPAAPTADGALRPWLVLVVVELGPGVRYAVPPAGPPTLEIDGDRVASELWDLADSYAWTHVQSAVPDAQVAAAIAAGSGAVIARMLCPRKLRADRSYRAAVVPAFDVGVAAALGEPVSATEIAPAWDIDAGEPVRLPVLATWSFATAEQPGDFEALAQRLRPDDSGSRLGFRVTELDVGGLLPKAPGDLDMRFEYAGMLTDPGARPQPLPRPTATWLDKQLTAAIERGTQRATVAPKPPANYRPERDDPVIAPTFYGAWAAGRHRLPEHGWLRQTNLEMPNRAAAGLGAAIVRAGEHDFLASAWDQVGALRQATVEINRARLVAAVADRRLERLAALDDAALLFAVGSTKESIAIGAQQATTRTRSVASALRASAIVPEAVVSSAFFRAARPASGLGRKLRADAAAASLSGRVGNQFLAASAPDAPATSSAVSEFTAGFVPDGAVTSGNVVAVHRIVATGRLLPLPPAAAAAVLAAAGPAAAPPRAAPQPPTRRRRVTGADRADEAAAAVRRSRPSRSVAASIADRLAGLHLADDRLPTRTVVGPWFPDGLAARLQALSPEFLLPGIDRFANDRVRLLEINETAVAALLVGANHEWAREALWREFPCDLGATVFASLFDRPGDPPAPGADTDLNSELAAVAVKSALASMIGGTGTATVLLIRAELVRRFPGLIVTMLEPLAKEPPIDANGNLLTDHLLEPMFVGHVDAATMFVGFDIDPARVLRDSWFVNVEEPPSGPRFGLDVGATAAATTPPRRWEQLTWGHVRAADPAMTHLRFGRLGWNGEQRQSLTWGRNSAEQAAIVFQRPFRVIFPAAALIGGGR